MLISMQRGLYLPGQTLPLSAAADGVHLPGIESSKIVPALALVYRRDLLQKNDAPVPQERRWRHRILCRLTAVFPRPGRDRCYD